MTRHEAEPATSCSEHANALRAVLDDPAENLGHPALPSALAAASGEERSRVWTAMDVALGLPGTPYLRPIALALREHPGPQELMQRLAAVLRSHAYCAPRAFCACTCSAVIFRRVPGAWAQR